MGEVLFVSKPVTPPWNDSSKNLVRDLARHLRGHRAHVMVGEPGLALGDAMAEPVYRRNGQGFAPAIRDQLSVLKRLAFGPAVDLFHFFFAPNPRSSVAAAALTRARRVPSVQTVCSAPKAGADLGRVLFADRVVVLSEHTRRRFIAEGYDESRLVHIPPCVPPLVEATVFDAGPTLAGPPVLLYPGDLEFSAGADRCLEVLHDLPERDAILVIAARMKTPRAVVRMRDLQERAEAMGIGPRVRFAGEVPNMLALLASATCVLLPAETLYAKMDLPLVLLEAMQVRRPVVVLEGTAAAELAVEGAAIAVPDNRDALATTVAALLDDPARRAALGQAAAEQVRSRFGPETMAHRYAVLYDLLLA